MANRVIAEVSAETLRLQAIVESLQHGDQMTYDDFGKRAQVKMDNDGKAKLRVAIKRAGRVASCIRGMGIKMADAKSVMPMLSQRVVSIDRAVRRADKTHSTLQEQFFSSLSPEEQKQVLFAGAVFGAIRIAASNGRMLYSRNRNKNPSQTLVSIPLPG